MHPHTDTTSDPGVELLTTRRCVRCGYDLRGLSVDGACPECGLSVRRSIRGELLRHEPPVTLGLYRGGTAWCMIAVALWLVAHSARVVFPNSGVWFDALTLLAMGPGTAVAFLRGLGLLATPLDCEGGDGSGLRAMAWVPVIGVFGVYAAQLAGGASVATTVRHGMTLTMAALMAMVARRVRQLTARVPSALAMRFADITLVLLAGWLISAVFEMFGSRWTARGIWPVSAFFVLPVGVSVLTLLMRLRTDVSEEIGWVRGRTRPGPARVSVE